MILLGTAYTHKKDEGVISNAQENQLVQRPCDARFGQGWSMKVIPNSKFFQLEAIGSDKNCDLSMYDSR